MPSTISRPSRMVLAAQFGVARQLFEIREIAAGRERPPAPVITAARAVGSSVNRCHIRARPTCRSSLTALRASGRFSVMIRSAPSARTSISSGMSYMSDSQSQDPRSDDVLLYLRRPAHDALRAAVQVGAEQVRVAGAADRQARRARPTARPRSSAACPAILPGRATLRRVARRAGAARDGSAFPPGPPPRPARRAPDRRRCAANMSRTSLPYRAA